MLLCLGPLRTQQSLNKWGLCMVQFYLLPSPPGIPPGICNFFLTWRSIPHPWARRKRQFPTPGTPHRPPIRCFVAKPDVLARTSTIF